MFKKYFENFKKCTAINEDFDQTEYVPLAMNYLKKRSGDNDYVHKPLLTDANLKYFDVSVKGKLSQ